MWITAAISYLSVGAICAGLTGRWGSLIFWPRDLWNLVAWILEEIDP